MIRNIKSILIATLFPFAVMGAAAPAAANNADCDTGAALRQTSAATDPQHMQQQMTRMHELMHRMQTTDDSAERLRLQQEHAQLVQENMRTMGMAMQKNAMQSASAPSESAAVGSGAAGSEK